ncbi:flagellar basal body-associated FliL family protein [Undibacterium sp. Rencai35W]|uniref:flagellar basal body-associated FliL family protein n=1 Tax=Undibacterium sp. Rencai35W TaxID=3413046 RepID=UPI003BEFE754
MKKNNAFHQAVLFCVFCASLLLTGMASANSGGKEASASGGSATTKLEPFTVNLSTSERYLQVSLTLQLANAEIGEKIKVYMPVVRHFILLGLSSKEPAPLQTGEGKRELIEELRNAVNKALDVKEHDGVTDIFFENFVIQ